MNKKILTLILLCFFFFFSCSNEKKDWKNAEAKNTIEAYNEFLSEHPEGSFADKARFKILKIQKSYFEEAESKNTIQAYEDFLKQFPKGSFADKARSKIQEIEKFNFKEAESKNTMPAYQMYLEQYPHGRYADQARLRIENLHNERHPAFKQTKTIKIKVSQSYSEDQAVYLPFESLASGFFQCAGLEVVGEEATHSDVTLSINAKGKALGITYTVKRELTGLTNSIGNYMYTGASLSGMISLKASGLATIKDSFKGSISPPRSFTLLAGKRDEYSTPSQAPWRSVLRQSGSFVPKVLKMIRKYYGISSFFNVLQSYPSETEETYLNAKAGSPEVEHLISLLKGNLDFIRWRAAQELGEIKDSRAVEPLIEALRDEDKTIRRSAASALGKLKNKRAVEPMIASLKDDDSNVREEAIRFLGEIMDPRAIEPLIACLKDDVLIRMRTVIALKKITGVDLGQDPLKWQNWWEENKVKYLEKR
jgi:outer membrane protein assembly factor BamD (BamD/ComL family)